MPRLSQPWHPAVFIAIVAAAGPVLPGAALAQSGAGPEPAVAPAVPVRFAGNDAFRYILYALDLQPLTNLQQIDEDPGNAVVIVFGDTASLDRVPGGLERFLEQGGALLVATDHEAGGALQRVLGVRVTGRHLQTRQNHYRDSPDCPLVRHFNRKDPLFKSVKAIATNVPSTLESTRRPGTLDRLSPVAWFPYEDTRRRGRLIPEPFAMAAPAEARRVLVLSDDSVFLNGMMLQPDNDNLTFAYNCIEWLTGPDRRRHVLFLDDGRVVTDWSDPLKDLAKPPPLRPPPLPVANKLLAGLEDENMFNRLLLSVVPLNAILSVLAIAATAALVAFGLVRLLETRHRFDPNVPPLAKALEQLSRGES